MYKIGDEENAYIFYMKYFNLINIIQKSREFPSYKDKTRDYFGTNSDINKRFDVLAQLKDSLKKRWAENEICDSNGWITESFRLDMPKRQKHQNAKWNLRTIRKMLKSKMHMSHRPVETLLCSSWCRRYTSKYPIKVKHSYWWTVVRNRHFLNLKYHSQI